VDFLEWAKSPWGQNVPTHIAWFLIWVAIIAGFLFFIVHTTYLRYFAKVREFAGSGSPLIAARIPEHVPRHSLTARLFHWVMAASMFTLLFTAFLPKVGFRFDWVTYHWIAGTVLTLSILFHIIHASFFLDFWAIWPDRIDVRDAGRRILRFMGKSAPPPDKFAIDIMLAAMAGAMRSLLEAGPTSATVRKSREQLVLLCQSYMAAATAKRG